METRNFGTTDLQIMNIEKEIRALKDMDAHIIEELTKNLVKVFTDTINDKMRKQFEMLNKRIIDIELLIKEMMAGQELVNFDEENITVSNDSISGVVYESKDKKVQDEIKELADYLNKFVNGQMIK